MNGDELFEKVYGSVIGGCIGDALGAPTEGMHYKAIREHLGVVEKFIEPLEDRRKMGSPRSFEPFIPEEARKYIRPTAGHIPDESKLIMAYAPDGYHRGSGSITDDMQAHLFWIEAINHYGRRIDRRELELYNRKIALECENSPYEYRRKWDKHKVLISMYQRRSFWNRWNGRAFMGVGGLINAGDPDRGAEDGGIVGTAVAEAMKPDATVESIIQAVIERAVVLGDLANEFVGKLYWIMKKVKEKKIEDVLDLIPILYREESSEKPFEDPIFLANMYNWQLENFPVALGMIYIAKGDPWRAVVGCTNFGRDGDSSGAVAGLIAGALKGIDALPKDMVEQVLQANSHINITEMTQKLTPIIKQNMEKPKWVLNYRTIDSELYTYTQTFFKDSPGY